MTLYTVAVYNLGLCVKRRIFLYQNISREIISSVEQGYPFCDLTHRSSLLLKKYEMPG